MCLVVKILEYDGEEIILIVGGVDALFMLRICLGYSHVETPWDLA